MARVKHRRPSRICMSALRHWIFRSGSDFSSLFKAAHTRSNKCSRQDKSVFYSSGSRPWHPRPGRPRTIISRCCLKSNDPAQPSMRLVTPKCILRSMCFAMLILVLSIRAGWSATVEIYYGPDDAPLDRLTTLYHHATRYLYVAVYGLTSPRAVEAMVAAKKRGVDVRMITDRQRTEDIKQRTALDTLLLAGIPILVNEHDGLMHLKQVVIDDEVNTTGQ